MWDLIEAAYKPGIMRNYKMTDKRVEDLSEVQAAQALRKIADGALCAVCGKVQYNTPSGITCANGHGGADSVYPEPTPSRAVGLSPTHEAEDSDRTAWGKVEDEIMKAKMEPVADVPLVRPRQAIIQYLSGAVSELAEAYKCGTEANAMCADVAVFQRMTVMQKELGAMMLEVNKMRGL